MSTIENQPSRGSVAAVMSAARLDQMEWPVSLSIMAYGVTIGVRANDRRVAEGLAGHLPPGFMSGAFSDTGRVYSLLVEEDELSGRYQNVVYVDGALLA